MSNCCSRYITRSTKISESKHTPRKFNWQYRHASYQGMNSQISVNNRPITFNTISFAGQSITYEEWVVDAQLVRERRRKIKYVQNIPASVCGFCFSDEGLPAGHIARYRLTTGKIRAHDLNTAPSRVSVPILRNAASLRSPFHLGPRGQNTVLVGSSQDVSALLDSHRAFGVVT